MGWFDWGDSADGGGIDWGALDFGGEGAGYLEGFQPEMQTDWSGIDWNNFQDDMAIQMPTWSGYTLPDNYVEAASPQAYLWDTTLGRVITPSGGEMPQSPQAGDGTGSYVQSPTGGHEQDYTQMPPQFNAPGTGRGEYVTSTGEPGQPGGPSVWDQVSGGMSSVNKVLSTPMGRGVGALALGAAGLGIQQAVANRGGSYKASPLTQAREARVSAAEATAAPAEAAIRGAAYPQVAALMQPGSETPINDPVRMALRDELMSVLTGNRVSASTQQRQQQEEQELRARLYRQEGRDYELTTAGSQALNQMKERFNREQENERLAKVNALGGQEQSRMQFQETAPTNVYGARENIRRGNLQSATALTQLGMRDVNPDQAYQINYGAQQQRNNSLAQGVGAVAGTVAGAVTQRPSALDQYFDRLYGSSNGLSSGGSYG